MFCCVLYVCYLLFVCFVVCHWLYRLFKGCKEIVATMCKTGSLWIHEHLSFTVFAVIRLRSPKPSYYIVFSNDPSLVVHRLCHFFLVFMKDNAMIRSVSPKNAKEKLPSVFLSLSHPMLFFACAKVPCLLFFVGYHTVCHGKRKKLKRNLHDTYLSEIPENQKSMKHKTRLDLVHWM